MAKLMMKCLCYFSYQLLLILILTAPLDATEENQKNFYVAYLGDQPVDKDLAVQTHIQILASVKGGSYHDAKESIVYSYTESFNAFAAKLSNDEAQKLQRMDRVLSVFPNRYHQLHTTRSWDFIGLPQTARRNLKIESDIVVGLMDTGITPESESFKDSGFGPPPAKWKGKCDHFANFSGCNNKLIGARYFKLDGNPDPWDILSPIDVDGHGTHTSSTLAGNVVANASLYGLARGAARGAVPNARVAAYKVCWVSSGCSDMDILAAFDAAIHDGVNVISISIGGATEDYASDTISVGAFHALKKGIVTVASAGNDGPKWGTVSNHAPWLVTVAASGIDRQFKSKVKTGNGRSVSGVGVNTFDPKEKFYPLVSGADVAKNSESRDSARFCFGDSLDPKKVKGKLVYCKLGTWGADSVIKGIGGVGIIVGSEQFLDVAQIYMAPGTMVNVTDGDNITDYIHSTRSPSAVIYKSQEVKVRAPFIASFSSRGPNPGSKHLLKPDIAAPGIDILASYTLMKSLTGLKGDTQYSKFTLMSGTSMACPHIAGVVAYVKSFHPSWSPAAIKSAIMTTAKPMSQRVNNEAEFAYGAGQVNPQKAVSPGLVYDMDDMSYIQFLCHEGYNGSSLAVLVGSKSINCTSLIPGVGYDALNYPTMQVSLKSNGELTTAIFRRRVTNVGPRLSIYNATIKAPKGVNITVKPMSLSFSRTSHKRSFSVVVKAKPMSSTQVLSAIMVLRTFLLLLVLTATTSIASIGKQTTYVIHMDKSKIAANHSPGSVRQFYEAVIDSINKFSSQQEDQEQETTPPQILYAYENAISGFSAKLSTKQLKSLETVDGFLSATPDELLTLHTTYSPHFLGLESGIGLWDATNLAKDVIVGVIDTGIWPEHIAFQDTGMPPVPSRWKGGCEEGTKFSQSNCNNKLIGARAFFKGYESVVGRINETVDYRSPRDAQGHGTHTASTAAGNIVANANLFGLARGKAAGMRYTSRIAAYKACWSLGCSSSDILAAIDKAVADGVDVLSLSLGGSSRPYYRDTIAIASFGATQIGVFVSCSAGNSGPSISTVDNTAPWIMTVAASYTDRSFPAIVKLGNGHSFEGSSLYSGKGSKQLPLVFGKTAGVSGAEGPSLVGHDVIKPDVTAPGVNILAAWPATTSPSMLKSDDRRVLFNIISGTSMSCPHVSGLAALLKSVHEDWSTAAIKSALMTTAYTLNNRNSPIADVGGSSDTPLATAFAFGSGHVDPESASDPGLIYDIATEDYLDYLCSLNYTSLQLALFAGGNFTCPNPSAFHPGKLNYPSFAVNFKGNVKNMSLEYERSVTNVGTSYCTYAVKVEEPNGVLVTITPPILSFQKIGEILSYKVTFVSLRGASNESFGSLTWVSGKYAVKSPIAVTWQ
ncbi:hypothetical protein CUMW_063980 [Citrus unshiu]|nr:hypothetical protein CUMW_063980 [Citrus unshiu]